MNANSILRQRREFRPKEQQRKGAIVVLAAATLVMIFGFVAFSVDTGYIALTKAQLQNAADASALAAAQELVDGYNLWGVIESPIIEQNARDAAEAIAQLHANGDATSTQIDTMQDVRFGRRTKDPVTNEFHYEWGVPPYDTVEVTLRRARSRGTALNLFFAPVIGNDNAEIIVSAKTGIRSGVGVKIPPTDQISRAGVLPITLDVGTWELFMDDYSNGAWGDVFKWDEEEKRVRFGHDGIKEINIYPEAYTNLPPGNRGLCDWGHPSNSKADTKRQILEGLSEYDLSFYPNNEIRFDNGPMDIPGNTGLAASIQNPLNQIKGEVRLLPLFSAVHGNGNGNGGGNNTVYTIVKLVPVRILDAKLTGPPSQKRLIVQPAAYSDSAVIPGEAPDLGETMEGDSYFSSSAILD